MKKKLDSHVILC